MLNNSETIFEEIAAARLVLEGFPPKKDEKKPEAKDDKSDDKEKSDKAPPKKGGSDKDDSPTKDDKESEDGAEEKEAPEKGSDDEDAEPDEEKANKAAGKDEDGDEKSKFGDKDDDSSESDKKPGGDGKTDSNTEDGDSDEEEVTGKDKTKVDLKPKIKPAEAGDIPIDEGLRLVKDGHHELGRHTAKVYKDNEWDEHRVKFFTDGKHRGEDEDYHTDDVKDAHDTAKAQLKRFSEGVEITEGQTAKAYKKALKTAGKISGSLKKGPASDYAQRAAMDKVQKLRFQLAKEAAAWIADNELVEDEELGSGPVLEWAWRGDDIHAKVMFESGIEEVVLVTELSKGTLGRYAKRATSDSNHSSNMAGINPVHAPKSDRAQKGFEKHWDKSAKRQKFIGKAIDRLTKESVEQIDELFGKGKLDDIKDAHDKQGSTSGKLASLADKNGFGSDKLDHAVMNHAAGSERASALKAYSKNRTAVNKQAASTAKTFHKDVKNDFKKFD